MSATARIRWSLVAAAVLFAGGIFLLLGLPGAFILDAAVLLAPSGITTFKGDKAWPAAICVTAAMPVGVILSAVSLAVIAPDAKLGPSMLAGLLGYVLAGLVTATALIVIN
jgi:hypothetical protein